VKKRVVDEILWRLQRMLAGQQLRTADGHNLLRHQMIDDEAWITPAAIADRKIHVVHGEVDDIHIR